MRFALLIWAEFADAGGSPSQAGSDALDGYLSAMRAQGVQADLVWFALAPTARWTGGEPYDALVKGRGPRPPLFDPIDVYREIELAGILTVDCSDEETALSWASRFPFIVSIEVRRVSDGDDSTALAAPTAMLEVARGYWAAPTGIASQRVDDIIWNRHDLVPALLRALAETAPEGQLHMIGVGPLESLSIHFEGRGEDLTLDLLIAAEIPTDALMEILSGPWPQYLEKWNASERLKGILSEEQLAELRARSRDG